MEGVDGTSVAAEDREDWKNNEAPRAMREEEGEGAAAEG